LVVETNMKFNLINLLKETDKILATTISISCIFIITYLVAVSGKVHVSTGLYLIISLLTLVYCVIYLLICNNPSILKIREDKKNKYLFLIFYIFIISYIFSIFLIYNGMVGYQLSINYYLVITLMCGLISLEIIYAVKNMKYIILSQIIILGLNISLSQLIIFPNILGVDPWWHSMITNKIINEGYIPQSPYQGLPVFHLLLSFASIICNINYKTAEIIFITIPLIVIGIIFIYMISYFLFRSYKISLMASLLLIIGNYFIGFSFMPIPNSLGGLFLIIILYLIIIRDFKKSSVITVILMAAIILTHTVIASILAIILFVNWFGKKIYCYIHNININNSIFLKISISYTVAMVSWWILAIGPFSAFIYLIKNEFNINNLLVISEQVSNYKLTSVPPFEQIINFIGLYLFFSTTILGILIMVSKKSKINHFFYSLLGILLLSVSLVVLVVNIYFLNDRWYFISDILLSIPLSVSLFMLSNIINKKMFKTAIILIYILILSFTNIISPMANTNNSVLTPNTLIRGTFTKSEIIGASFTAKYIQGQIASDFYYAVSTSSSIFENLFNVSNSKILSIDNSLLNSQFTPDNSVVVIRNEIVNKPFNLQSGIWRLTTDPNKLLIKSDFDKIYDNGGINDYR
jgi:hypothetical protein